MRTRKLLHLLTALAVSVPLSLGVTSTAQAAQPPSLLPVSVANDSGRSEEVFLYVLGTDLATGKLGYVDEAGAFTAWTGGTNPPSPAPDVAIAGPGNGSAKTIQLPRGISGRMYMAFGQKLTFLLSQDGLVQPAPWAGGDPNRETLFDWSEFTYNDAGLWLNSSQVDMFSVPHSVSVTGERGTSTAGELKPGGRDAIFDAIANEPGPWSKLVHQRADGTRLRVLAPRLGMDSGFDPTYLDGYLTDTWNTYKDTDLTVVPFQFQPNLKYTGRTDGDGVLQFTDSTGRQVASFPKPETKDVFGCDGKLAAPNDDVVGPLARSLCAALHRSTLGFLHTQPTYDGSQFYTRAVTDHYSKNIHANMVDGKAYGFAFDDVGGFESLVFDGVPSSVKITLTSF
ncbi:beta-1,3-glucanase family protein [Umezawaea sp. Da 62-37]|uniref:beta-1,3-glucanase family protein n=1 Tax=Umezawaea sp. Da 62-37 TaxID=3075927 RepID=UPI0028F73A4D|nr:beta-1,3-glucanase family protein [Umezawaea sp. Da 62-37]WNV86478.1 beta-1,3-glucanase family protein [Umezawaea sp. Da 62-37]